MEGLSPLESGQDVLLGRCGRVTGGSDVPGSWRREGRTADPADWVCRWAPLPSGNKPLWEPKFPSERRRPLIAHLQLNFIFFG